MGTNNIKIKLSIVIPYYKTLELTKKLLDTLVKQKTDEVEIIVIDDGCNEKELDIYKNDIVLKHLKENKGGAGATNVGLDLAKGKYISLIDSDDMVADYYIETLLIAINERTEDVIFFDWKDMGTNQIVHRPQNYAPWKAIYRKEIMPRFRDGWKYSYDVPFQEDLAKINYSKFYLDKVLYFYNSARPDNLTHEKARYIKNRNMKYVILADSRNTEPFETPRQLTEINGEPLVGRTVRLLKENGVENILITAHDKRFDNLGAKRYEPLNNKYDPFTLEGYWLNGFCEELLTEPICYLFGDVYYSEDAIKTIINSETDSTLFFCTDRKKGYGKNYTKNHDEPLGYKVIDYELFKRKIKETKKLKDEGVCCREPVVWELYRIINGIWVNEHKLTENYIAICDETSDIDCIRDIEPLKKVVEK